MDILEQDILDQLPMKAARLEEQVRELRANMCELLDEISNMQGFSGYEIDEAIIARIIKDDKKWKK